TPTPATPQNILNIGSPAQAFTFYVYGGKVRMLLECDRTAVAPEISYDHADAPAPEPDVWTHYCGTYDGETIKIYRDGKLAAAKKMATKLSPRAFDNQTLDLGNDRGTDSRLWRGALDDVAVWNRALTAADVATLFNDGPDAVAEGRVALWDAASATADGEKLVCRGGSLDFVRRAPESLLNKKDSGYRGIWYYIGKLQTEYAYKYAGGLGTYPANHYPFAVYRPEVDKTFFCYGGTDPDAGTTLWHEVGVFDHKTGKVSRPTVICDKKTNDAHDNPVISVDDDGRIWIFSTSHGVGRPSFIWRSVEPYDISRFEKVEAQKLFKGEKIPMDNFSYWQVWNVPERGFSALFTTYDRAQIRDKDPDTVVDRMLATTRSADGVEWAAWRPFAAIERGHYQNACVFYDREKKAADGKPFTKYGTAFNYHPAEAKGNRGVGLDWRTNLYYMESVDFGESWASIEGNSVETPLLKSQNPALVRDYEAEGLNVYVVDLVYDADGFPVIGYITAKGWESGPENGPRDFCIARWTGEKWNFSKVCVVDNNYDYAMIYAEEGASGVLRIVGALDDGPQKFNTGGEVSQWVSRNNGETWEKEFQLTENSEFNQCYPRRTIDANPGFYAFWADGNGRAPSASNLYFSTKDGKVFKLPREMRADWEEPIRVK
ncbi:MAG: BNR-4 repeat-containing protein, partial [Thermoguttaceae bacterium]|nr:BNR-4 repeat-containing protein [Thermoguttaceae bacterium]